MIEPDNELWEVDRRLMLRREIDAAIHLFFDGNDIPARILAWAALDVLRILLERAKIDSMHLRLEDHIRSEYVREWRGLLRDHYNYLKHADRDPDRVLYDYRPATTAFNLLGAVADYGSLYRAHTLPMATFKAWAFARYPRILNDHTDLPKYLKAIDGADGPSFALSLVSARDHLRLYRDNRDEIIARMPDNVRSAFEDL
jgi:hypothetical protein